jgi:hypothetical protein
VNRLLTVASIAALALALAFPALASANAPNPLPGTSGTETVNGDGSVTVQLSGTWSWPGQACGGRYGIGWAVDWWGITSSKAVNPAFALTGASEVVAAGPASKPWLQTALSSGTVSPVGAIAIPHTPNFFHVGSYYAGEDTNLCALTMSDGTPYGPWTASATYPTGGEIPATLCVNIYDEHGSAGKSSGNPGDFSPVKDSDNSIQTNTFDPASNGYCIASSSLASSGAPPPPE